MPKSLQTDLLPEQAITKMAPGAVPTDQLKVMYRVMFLIRRVEESLLQMAESGKIGGAMHTAIGHEANAVGSAAALQPGDYVTCTYRGHHHALARGMDPKEAIAEVLGRATGFAKGKGGSMHFIKPEIGLMGANGIVGAQVPHAAGMALASQLRDDGRVAMTFFGEGAHLPGCDARDLQHRPEVASADHLLLREQPLFRDDAHRTHVLGRGDLPLSQGRLRHGERPDRRQRRRAGLSGGARGRRARPGRRGTDFHRGADLPPGRPHGRRPRDVSLDRRDRSSAQARAAGCPA